MSFLLSWLTQTLTPCIARHLRWANLPSCAVTISELETAQTSSTQAGSITGSSFFTATLYFWLRA